MKSLFAVLLLTISVSSFADQGCEGSFNTLLSKSEELGYAKALLIQDRSQNEALHMVLKFEVEHKETELKIYKSSTIEKCGLNQ